MVKVNWILYYLKSSPGKGFFSFKHNYLQVGFYIGADLAASIVEQSSILEYCTLEAGNQVTWESKKQYVVARLSVKTEFRALQIE